MDNLTHTLIGVAVAESVFLKKWGRAATWILAITSNLADVDVFLLFSKIPDAFLYRRTITHSILGVPIIALLAGVLFKCIFKDLKYKTIVGLSLLGLGLHVFFDLLNSYGVVVLYPFSMKRFEFGTVFIIDLALWLFLLIPLVLLVIPSIRHSADLRQRIWQVSVACMGLYVGVCFWARSQAKHIFLDHLKGEAVSYEFLELYPEALGPHRFRGIYRAGNEYNVFQINILNRTVVPDEKFVTLSEDPEIKLIRESPRVKKLEWFFSAPVWQKNPGLPDEAVVFDLRFRSTVLKGRRPAFSYRFPLPSSSAKIN